MKTLSSRYSTWPYSHPLCNIVFSLELYSSRRDTKFHKRTKGIMAKEFKYLKLKKEKLRVGDVFSST
jgi:hypothetical protein